MKKNIEFINAHPLNKSKTKQAHAFSRSPRFSRVAGTEQIIDNFSHNASYYNLSSSAVQLRPKSSTVVFSKAKRFRQDQLVKKSLQRLPSPHSYKSPDFLQASIKKKKGITFPQSPKLRKTIEILPGPGQYQRDRYNPQHSPSFSIPKNQKSKDNSWNKLGPGEYQNVGIKRASSPATIGKQKRFRYKTNENPAPGEYEGRQSFNEESRIHGNAPKFSFGSSERKSWFKDQIPKSPGPASYNVGFSQFSQRSKRIFQILNRL